MTSRVEYLTSPGEGVVLTDDLETFIERVDQFLEESGLPPEDVVVNPVVSIPMPLTAQHNGERKRLTFRPELAWFPMFWLPLSIGLRFSVQERENGPLRVESDAEWAVRVISQMADAGLFDPESGTWIDALETVGLDRNDPEVHARVMRWQNGADDPDLDRIDLGSRFNGTGEESAAYTIMRAHDFQHAQWAITAKQILAHAERLEQIDGLDEFTSEVEKWAQIASLGFSGSPADAQFQAISDRLSVQSDPDEELDLLVKLAQQLMEENLNSLEALVA